MEIAWMTTNLKQEQRVRLKAIAEKLASTELASVLDYESLFEKTTYFAIDLRSTILWLTLIGNYPSRDEAYLLHNYINTSHELTIKWLKKKRFAYVMAGLPKTYISQNSDLLFFDVSETWNSPINSGIQRIVRETAKQMAENLQFVRWDARYGIHTTLARTELSNILLWEPHKTKRLNLYRKIFAEFPSLSLDLKRRTVRYFSGKGTLGIYLIKVLKKGYELSIKILALKNFSFFRRSVCIVFQPDAKILVLELQSLDLRILERVSQQQRAGLHRYSFLVHDTLPIRFPEFFTPGLVGNYAYYFSNLSAASTLFVMADAEKGHLEKALKALGANTQNIMKIEPPLNSDLKVPELEDIQRFARKQILIVGSLEPRKNHVRMIRAIIESAKVVKNIRVVLVYPNSWLSESIALEIEHGTTLGINFDLHESVSDEELYKFYSESSILMYCSLAEGLGLPLLEARIFSLPAVTSNRDFMSRVAEIGGAISVNPLDVTAISEGVTNLLSNYGVWQETAKLCKKEIGIPWKDYALQFKMSGVT